MITDISPIVLDKVDLTSFGQNHRKILLFVQQQQQQQNQHDFEGQILKLSMLYYTHVIIWFQDLFTQRAVEIIEKNNPKTSPLFLSVQYTTPHFPLQVNFV